jgi:plastocyanin
VTKKRPQTEIPKPAKHWPLHLHHRASQVVIFIVLVGLTLIYHFGRQHLPMSPAAAPVNQNQVSITASGFNPASLTIKIGGQVTWSNNDARPHHVVADMTADNPAPLGFDNDLVLHTGDSYSFSFIHPGAYTYHDLLNPGSAGTIIVQ